MIELTLNGLCLEYDFRALILTGTGAAEVATRAKWTIAAQGEIDLHLGVALFDRPFIFTPTRIITERQQLRQDARCRRQGAAAVSRRARYRLGEAVEPVDELKTWVFCLGR